MKEGNVSQQHRQEKTVKASRILGFWTGAWVITMAITNFGPRWIWDHNETISTISVMVNLLIGAGMIVANGNHLRTLDELHQKIQLEAMALSLGVGLIVGMAYSNLDVINVIPADAEISHLVMVMVAAYGFGIYKGMRKYR